MREERLSAALAALDAVARLPLAQRAAAAGWLRGQLAPVVHDRALVERLATGAAAEAEVRAVRARLFAALAREGAE